jgi:hypothetical protein
MIDVFGGHRSAAGGTPIIHRHAHRKAEAFATMVSFFRESLLGECFGPTVNPIA